MTSILLPDYTGEKCIEAKRGTQILHVPGVFELKTTEDFQNVLQRKWWSYPAGIQPGFISSGPNSAGDFFCRYFYYDHNTGEFLFDRLRTISNSEPTPQWSIVAFRTTSAWRVKRFLEAIDEGKLDAWGRIIYD